MLYSFLMTILECGPFVPSVVGMLEIVRTAPSGLSKRRVRVEAYLEE
jgi:hypothetical protein